MPVHGVLEFFYQGSEQEGLELCILFKYVEKFL
mgnify:CR=1 FL=1